MLSAPDTRIKEILLFVENETPQSAVKLGRPTLLRMRNKNENDPNLFFFPPNWGMLRRSKCVLIFLLKIMSGCNTLWQRFFMSNDQNRI